MTEEIKNDLEVLQMRSVLDPKHFYKKNDLKVLPKYFQVSFYKKKWLGDILFFAGWKSNGCTFGLLQQPVNT